MLRGKPRDPLSCRHTERLGVTSLRAGTPNASQAPVKAAEIKQNNQLMQEIAAAPSAKAKLELLANLQQRSKSARKELSMYAAGAPRLIDARVSL